MPGVNKAEVVEIRGASPTADLHDLSLPSSLELAVQQAAQDLHAVAPTQPSIKALQRMACSMYDARRARDRHFDSSILGEPGWDILLALYALPSRGELLGISSLAHCAGVPPTTGLRWEGLLREKGLIERGPHVSDKRVQLVRLTEQGRALMEGYLTRLYWISVQAGPGDALSVGAAPTLMAS